MKYNKQISLGYDMNGKRIRKWIHANSIAELNKKIDQAKMEHQLVPNMSDITFGEYSKRWMAAYKSNRSTQTQNMYTNALRKCRNLDRYPLRSVTKTNCQELVNLTWKTPRTAKIVADTLRQIFRTAVADGIILRNPADNLVIPESQHKTFRLLTSKELDALDRADLDPQDRMFVTILRSFGLRPAEALALQPSDFDFKRNVLTISKALELTGSKSTVKSTKTGKKREIPILIDIIPQLKAYIRDLNGFLLFTKTDGQQHTKSSYVKMSARILKKWNEALGGDQVMNMLANVTMYSFRHRKATDLYYLCQRGSISTKQAAALLGHSEEIFIRTYSHIDPEHEDLAAVTNL